jgi:hypothetical protein
VVSESRGERDGWGMLNPFRSRSYVLVTRLTPGECAQRLDERVEQWRFPLHVFWLPDENFIGKITDQGFSRTRAGLRPGSAPAGSAPRRVPGKERGAGGWLVLKQVCASKGPIPTHAAARRRPVAARRHASTEHIRRPARRAVVVDVRTSRDFTGAENRFSSG